MLLYNIHIWLFPTLTFELSSKNREVGKKSLTLYSWQYPWKPLLFTIIQTFKSFTFGVEQVSLFISTSAGQAFKSRSAVFLAHQANAGLMPQISHARFFPQHSLLSTSYC
jgi:hypothetical protein